jgi:NAD(P)-dependent dehydrogenase (short-subunit alcohol dehydrogenase family)
VALVTGASSGIGWAVCETLATAGMKVVAVARRRWAPGGAAPVVVPRITACVRSWRRWVQVALAQALGAAARTLGAAPRALASGQYPARA